MAFGGEEGEELLNHAEGAGIGTGIYGGLDSGNGGDLNDGAFDDIPTDTLHDGARNARGAHVRQELSDSIDHLKDLLKDFGANFTRTAMDGRRDKYSDKYSDKIDQARKIPHYVGQASKRAAVGTRDQVAVTRALPEPPSIVQNILPSTATFLYTVGVIYLSIATINYGIIKHQQYEEYDGRDPVMPESEKKRYARQDAILGCIDLTSWYNLMLLVTLGSYGFAKLAGNALYRTWLTTRGVSWTSASATARLTRRFWSSDAKIEQQDLEANASSQPYQAQPGLVEIDLKTAKPIDVNDELRTLTGRIEQLSGEIQRLTNQDQISSSTMVQPAAYDLSMQNFSRSIVQEITVLKKAIDTANSSPAKLPDNLLEPVLNALTTLQSAFPQHIQGATASLATKEQVNQLSLQLARMETALESKANEKSLQEGVGAIQTAITDLKAFIALQKGENKSSTSEIVEKQIAQIGQDLAALSKKINESSALANLTGTRIFTGETAFDSNTTATTTQPSLYVNEEFDFGEHAVVVSEDQVDARAKKIVSDVLDEVQRVVFSKIPEAQRVQLGFDDEGDLSQGLSHILRTSQDSFSQEFTPVIREALIASVNIDELDSYDGDDVRANAEAVKSSINDAILEFTLSIQSHELSRASTETDQNNRFQPIVSTYASAMGKLRDALTALKEAPRGPVPAGLFAVPGEGKKITRFGTVSMAVLDASANKLVSGGPALLLDECLKLAAQLDDHAKKEGAKLRLLSKLPQVIDDLHQEINHLNQDDSSDSDDGETDSPSEKHAKKCKDFLNKIVDSHPSEFAFTDEQNAKIKGIRDFAIMALVDDDAPSQSVSFGGGR